MTKVVLCISDQGMLQEARTALSSDSRYELVVLDDLKLEDGLGAAAEKIMASDPQVVVADYWSEDAAGVKLMQRVSDPAERPEFIFIDADGQAGREEVLMALNEGAHAFLPSGFSGDSLKNYVDRAILGPGRLRAKSALDAAGAEAAVGQLEEQLGEARIKAAGFQKVIAYLLSTPAGAQHRQVLVVSDSPYQLELLKKTLDDHGFSVLTASDAASALKIALSEKPRIIVSDLELPGGTGRELCRDLKFTHKLIPCHFIICTANLEKVSREPGDGIDDCLAKPSGPQDTVEFVARVAMGLLL